MSRDQRIDLSDEYSKLAKHKRSDFSDDVTRKIGPLDFKICQKLGVILENKVV